MNWAPVKIALIAVVAFSVVSQFVQPQHTNPPSVTSLALSARVQVPAQVQESLE